MRLNYEEHVQESGKAARRFQAGDKWPALAGVNPLRGSHFVWEWLKTPQRRDCSPVGKGGLDKLLRWFGVQHTGFTRTPV